MKIGFKKANILTLIVLIASMALAIGVFYVSNDFYKTVISFVGLAASIINYIIQKDQKKISEIIKKTNVEIENLFVDSIKKSIDINRVILKLNPLAKFYIRYRFEKYKKNNSSLSKKGIALTESIVKIEAEKTRTITIVLFMVMNVEYIFFSKYDGIDAVSTIQFILFALLFLRYLLIKFRVNNGYFGLNRYEAMMIIRFIEKNKDDLNGSGGEKVKIFKDREEKEAEGVKELIGGVVIK